MTQQPSHIIREVKEADFIIKGLIQGHPLFELRDSGYIFFKGWGLSAYKFSLAEATKVLKYYYKSRKIFTEEQFIRFGLELGKGNNPFADIELMKPIIANCLFKGYMLQHDVIPLAISELTDRATNKEYTLEELKLVDQLCMDNHTELMNYYWKKGKICKELVVNPYTWRKDSD